MIAALLLSLLGTLAMAAIPSDHSGDFEPEHDEDLDPPQPEEITGDLIITGVNSNFVEGTAGDDWIQAGRSCDTVEGGDGDDSLFGERGRDMLYGEDGDDFLNGGAWHDGLDGGAGDDTLEGDTGRDTLAGGAGDDLLDGGAWDDLLVGGAGSDVLVGGNGDDVLIGYVPETIGDDTDISVRAYHEAGEMAFGVRDDLAGMDDAALMQVAEENLATTQDQYPGQSAGADGANVLDGGHGNDTIGLWHDGDQATGGSGSDEFVAFAWNDSVDEEDDAPLITDFDPTSDVLTLQYEDTDATPTVTIDTLEDGSQLLRSDGDAVVLFAPGTPLLDAEDVVLTAIAA